ncbi:MAG TPA: YeeE/YedE family protein [Rhizobium sp.]|uniref:DUF6691 family protein n=1 Tax=Rhizobium sp. F40D2 TaxID=3453141 RepID=UPI002B85B0F5|nr:YeeE/YedE family protein [Rhizobium sp.]
MNGNIYKSASALASGIVFGFGLSLSGMLNPTRVQGFLDVFGGWDPSLAFVLGGAVVVAFAGMQMVKRMHRPAFDGRFHIPTGRRIDAPLVAGSAIFGLGWGIGGLCPGPAVASLPIGFSSTAVFVIAMLAGMALYDRVWSRRS